jgi:hypothetical protein
MICFRNEKREDKGNVKSSRKSFKLLQNFIQRLAKQWGEKTLFAFTIAFVLMHGMSFGFGGRMREKRSSNNKDNMNKTEN